MSREHAVKTDDFEKVAQSMIDQGRARPGGRWYRDLGEDNGHFWGTVQAIKRPTLLEITGPLFMSYAAVSNLQYRLSSGGGHID
jgi:hypothetical protein